MVLHADGIKIPKEGKKMPAVKCMHQQSQSNSKAEFIMGHFLQAASLAVVNNQSKISSIPLTAEIHDGVVFSNRSRSTTNTRFCKMVKTISSSAEIPAIVVADAYYSVKKVICDLTQERIELVSRVAHNTSAHYPAVQAKKRKRGRPRIKGEKVKLNSFFSQFDEIATEYRDSRYYCIDLYWQNAGRLIRFVLVESPKGRAILMTTKMDLSPETVIDLYKSRWLIETGFKQAIHTVGTFNYHFWMKAMKPIKRGQSKQYLHRESAEYRNNITKKMKAFHVHIMAGCITQGLLQYLAINFKDQVWSSFKGWLRTINNSIEPSELVVSNALRTSLTNFIGAKQRESDWVKFMAERTDTTREGPLAKVG